MENRMPHVRVQGDLPDLPAPPDRVKYSVATLAGGLAICQTFPRWIQCRACDTTRYFLSIPV